MNDITENARSVPFTNPELEYAKQNLLECGNKLGTKALKPRFAFLPTKLSSGETIWLKSYVESMEFVGRYKGFWISTGIKFKS